MKVLTEDSIRGDHLRVQLLDVNRFIKVNNIKEITNPITFQRNNIPTSDGLLSNEIFGITLTDRQSICAYIDLGEYFMNPLVYKIWGKLDKKIIECVHGINNFKINDKGELQVDPEGDSGIEFIRKNIDKINIARTASVKRDLNVDFIESHKKDPGMFINKWIVSPAGYRDVDTSKEGKVAIGEINELYRNLIVTAKALKESTEYGLDMGEANRGRIQEILHTIFEWYGNGTKLNGIKTGSNIPGKRGVLRRSVMSKTTDYASRLVLSAPELKYDSVDEMQVDLDHSALSLGSALTNFQPFVIFHIKRFFENTFASMDSIPSYIKRKNGKIEPTILGRTQIKDYQEQFSEERIKKEIKRFLTGISNRLIPVEIEDVNGNMNKLRLKGYDNTPDAITGDYGAPPIVDRTLTWCDLFFIAAVEATKDKHIITVRYPIDSIYNQFPSNIRINSTNETESLVINGILYTNYPKIREEDIGTDTPHMFVDTLTLSNLYLDGMKGDYDGDQTTVKGIFTKEANEELDKTMQMNYNYIDSSGRGIRKASNEAIQAMYSLSFVLPEDKDKLSKPVFAKKK